MLVPPTPQATRTPSSGTLPARATPLARGMLSLEVMPATLTRRATIMPISDTRRVRLTPGLVTRSSAALLADRTSLASGTLTLVRVRDSLRQGDNTTPLSAATRDTITQQDFRTPSLDTMPAPAIRRGVTTRSSGSAPA